MRTGAGRSGTAWRRAAVAGLMAAAGLVPARAEWYDDLKIKGDVRYRFERIEEEGKDGRDRDRIRARLGVFPRINDSLDLGFQLTTDEPKSGIGDPISGNQTLTDEGAKKGIFVDLAYLAFHPLHVKGLELTAGKMKNPFLAVGDYLWDNDYTPEGLAAQYRLGDELQLRVNGAYHWLAERAVGDDTKLYGGQAAVQYQPDTDKAFVAGASFYYFDNMDGQAVLDWTSSNKGYGNRTRDVVSGTSTSKVYAGGYSVFEGFAQAVFPVVLPVTLFGSVCVNVEADDDNLGFMAGLTVGALKDPGSFQLGYNYRRLEKDAFVGAFTDSDSWGGGTDGQGHKISAAVQILKNWQGGVAFFLDDKHLDDSKEYRRLQVDLTAKF